MNHVRQHGLAASRRPLAHLRRQHAEFYWEGAARYFSGVSSAATFIRSDNWRTSHARRPPSHQRGCVRGSTTISTPSSRPAFTPEHSRRMIHGQLETVEPMLGVAGQPINGLRTLSPGSSVAQPTKAENNGDRHTHGRCSLT
jgi:hypothetical protein